MSVPPKASAPPGPLRRPLSLPRQRATEATSLRPASLRGRLPDETPLAAGGRVGEYVIEATLGEGGFGRVYRVTHALIGKAAAVKVLNRALSADPVSVARFIEEARAVNRIRHRNIVDIFGFGTLEDGRHYYVMELLEGETLAQRLARLGPLSVADALAALRDVAGALSAAHAAGVVHRDLKPENVFITTVDGLLRAKLLDFGIAKLFNQGALDLRRTREGAYLGTPHFMAPEQCKGWAVDGRTDVYAFGVLAYKVLTGCVPFDAEHVYEILHQHVTLPPRPMSERFVYVPANFDAPVLRMLAKDPARRPATVLEAFSELELAAGPYAPGAPSDHVSSNPAPARRPTASLAAAITAAETLSGPLPVQGTLVWNAPDGAASRTPPTNPRQGSSPLLSTWLTPLTPPEGGADQEPRRLLRWQLLAGALAVIIAGFGSLALRGQSPLWSGSRPPVETASARAPSAAPHEDVAAPPVAASANHLAAPPSAADSAPHQIMPPSDEDPALAKPASSSRPEGAAGVAPAGKGRGRAKPPSKRTAPRRDSRSVQDFENPF